MKGLLQKLRYLLARDRRSNELAEEMEFHRSLAEQEGLKEGLTPEKARWRARRQMGNETLAREDARRVWSFPMLDDLLQDLRFALRSFRKSPGYTAAVLATLALGIGVGTAVFSIVNGVLLQPLPYKEPHRLVMLLLTWSGRPSRGPVSMGAGEFVARKDLSTTFKSMAAFRSSTWKIESEQARRIMSGLQVSDGFFDVLGVEPALGRRFLPEDHAPGADTTVILQDAIWRTQFNADPAVIGSQHKFWNSNATIVGVMPPGFVFHSRNTDYLTAVDLARYTDRDFRYTYFRSVARLADHVSIAEAQAEQDVLTSQFKQQYPDYEDTRASKLVPISEDTAGEVRPALTALVGAVVFLMLIVCANVANLILGRALGRVREMGVRAAIGAGRARLVRQLLTESLILSVAGGTIGFGIAQIIVKYFQAMAPDRSGWGSFLVQADSIGIDGATFAFAVAVTFLAGLTFGVVPAVRASRLDVNSTLKSGSGASGGSRRDRFLRNSLVVAQTALAFVLVCGAGLLIRSSSALYETGPGFQSRDRLQVRIAWSPAISQQRQQTLRESLNGEEFRREMGLATQLRADSLRQRILALPQVRDVAFSAMAAMGPRPSGVDFVVDPSLAATRELCGVIPKFVSPNFFAVMGIPLLEGRSFHRSDRLGTQPVMILSQQAVLDCAAGANVVDSVAPSFYRLGPSVRVVGVVGDVNYDGIDMPGRAAAYASLSQIGAWPFGLILHTDADPISVAPAAKEAIFEVDPNAIITDIRVLDHLVRDSAWKLNYSTILLGGLAALSLLLAAVGVYGVLSEMVRRQTREIGLRMALGAHRVQVLGTVLREGLGLVGVGVAIGLVAAVGLTRFLGSLLFEVEPLDLPTFAAVAFVLLGTAFLASYIPARLAASVDPMTALRHE